MTDQHCWQGNSSRIFILGKDRAFQFLEDTQLLNNDAIIVLMVSHDLLLLDLEVRPISPISIIDSRKIARSAVMNKAAGVILAEIYRNTRPWPSLNIEAEGLQQELLNHGLALIDVLVFESKHVRSRAFPAQTT